MEDLTSTMKTTLRAMNRNVGESHDWPESGSTLRLEQGRRESPYPRSLRPGQHPHMANGKAAEQRPFKDSGIHPNKLLLYFNYSTSSKPPSLFHPLCPSFLSVSHLRHQAIKPYPPTPNSLYPPGRHHAPISRHHPPLPIPTTSP